MAREITFEFNESEFQCPVTGVVLSADVTLLIESDGERFSVEHILIDEEVVTDVPRYLREFFAYWLDCEVRDPASRVVAKYREDEAASRREDRADSYADYVREQRAA